MRPVTLSRGNQLPKHFVMSLSIVQNSPNDAIWSGWGCKVNLKQAASLLRLRSRLPQGFFLPYSVA